MRDPDGVKIIGFRKALNNWLRQFKIIIDPSNKLYKIEESLLGIFRWGNFEPLPEADYVLVFNSFFAKCEACSLDENADYYYQVSLVHHKNRRIIVHETKSRAEIISMANILSESLNLKIRDASARNKTKWVSPGALN